MDLDPHFEQAKTENLGAHNISMNMHRNRNSCVYQLHISLKSCLNTSTFIKASFSGLQIESGENADTKQSPGNSAVVCANTNVSELRCIFHIFCALTFLKICSPKCKTANCSGNHLFSTFRSWAFGIQSPQFQTSQI